METSDRPFTSEPLRLANAAQDGDQPVGSSCGTEERLDDLHQCEGCIPSGSGASRQSSFSLVCCGWKGLPAQSALFWSLHGPSDVHQGHGSCVCHASRPKRLDTLVSGRLVSPSLFQEGDPVGKGRCSQSMSPAWNRGQLGQVSPRPLLHCHVSGDDVGEPLFEGFPISVEGFDPSVTACRIFILQAWWSLLGRLSSLCLLVPGDRLCLQSLQLKLHRQENLV